MVFGDESAGKTPKPPPQTKKDRKKKKKKPKSSRRRRGRGIIIRTKKNQWPLKYCGKRKVFFSGCRIGKITC
jgi:hypothetical protein